MEEIRRRGIPQPVIVCRLASGKLQLRFGGGRQLRGLLKLCTSRPTTSASLMITPMVYDPPTLLLYRTSAGRADALLISYFLHQNRECKMAKKRIFLFLATSFLFSSQAWGGEEENIIVGCTAAPEKKNGVTLGKAYTPLPQMYFVPKKIGEKYTGCAYVWLLDSDSPRPYQIGRFEAGNLVASSTFEFEELPKLTCKFSLGQQPENEECWRTKKFWDDFRSKQDEIEEIKINK